MVEPTGIEPATFSLRKRRSHHALLHAVTLLSLFAIYRPLFCSKSSLNSAETLGSIRGRDAGASRGRGQPAPPDAGGGMIRVCTRSGAACSRQHSGVVGRPAAGPSPLDPPIARGIVSGIHRRSSGWSEAGPKRFLHAWSREELGASSSARTSADFPLRSQLPTASHLKVRSSLRGALIDDLLMGFIIHALPTSLSVISEQPQGGDATRRGKEEARFKKYEGTSHSARLGFADSSFIIPISYLPPVLLGDRHGWRPLSDEFVRRQYRRSFCLRGRALRG